MKKYLTIDKIIGKQVIDSEGIVVGTVKDLAFDLVAREVSLTVNTKDNKEINIEGGNVTGVGDVILIGKAVKAPNILEKPKAPAQPPVKEISQEKTPGLCPECGYQNDPGNKFCIKCGTRL